MATSTVSNVNLPTVTAIPYFLNYIPTGSCATNCVTLRDTDDYCAQRHPPDFSRDPPYEDYAGCLCFLLRPVINFTSTPCSNICDSFESDVLAYQFNQLCEYQGYVHIPETTSTSTTSWYSPRYTYPPYTYSSYDRPKKKLSSGEIAGLCAGMLILVFGLFVFIGRCMCKAHDRKMAAKKLPPPYEVSPSARIDMFERNSQDSTVNRDELPTYEHVMSSRSPRDE